MKPPTERQCQALFDSYNRRFFGGRLPAYRVLLSGRFGTGMHGMCRRKEREIRLGTELRGAELRKRLIHEMAHAAANIGHGKLWKDEMHRLRRLGATREDPDAYGDPAQMVSRSKSRRASSTARARKRICPGVPRVHRSDTSMG